MSDAITPEAEASATPEAEPSATPEAETSVEEATTASTTATGVAEPSDAEATAASTKTAGSTQASDAEGRANPRKVREGFVVSTSMDKTAVIESIDRVRHRRYAKTVQRSTKLFAHDETNDANVGDLVRIQETRPLSKKKRWRLVEIIERAR